ncbi:MULTISPECIES: DNA alkylation repair protein [Odoribacteraceae]|jgi:3-methyladenine DNA glycosylase AlkD|nr:MULTISPECIES: DNA alkylation repair protein [Odoribacteraceae]RHV98370.1 hypothetical protein DXA95_01450 [Odoribacter sp. OF09-27XD]CCZ09680.1 putative uncharacterized protein [Odoribacter sp. CAG:788]
MEYSVLSPDTEPRFKEIQKRIRRLQNRGNIESLEHLGINTENQIGASFLSLKTLAACYQPDENLAILLWNTCKREEQIVACLLLPKKINKEKITQLIQSCYNTELAEYFGSLYLCHQENLKEIASEWSDSNIPFQQIAALTACARHLILYKSAPVISADFLKLLSHKDYTDKYVKLVASRYS